MAATRRPPEGLVLEGRERGGRLARGGEEGDASRIPYRNPETLPGSPAFFLGQRIIRSKITHQHIGKKLRIHAGTNTPASIIEVVTSTNTLDIASSTP